MSITINPATGKITSAGVIFKEKNLGAVPHKKIAGPDTIIIHYTAGVSGESSANWLSNPTSKVSAHIVIDRSGQIYQVISFNDVAWHAGQSAYGGRKNFNDFSIGIELDNAGYLQRTGNEYISEYGKKYSSNDVIEARHRNENFNRFWHTYTEAQILACQDLCLALIQAYPNITQILGHDEISPGRKQDPGPAFEMDRFRNRILVNDRESEVDEIRYNDILGEVLADKLNIREGPGTTFQKVALPLAKKKPIKIKGERNGWYRVTVEVEGWVSKALVEKKA
jgi:N-acetylmuramoyl-L-alanine amidase